MRTAVKGILLSLGAYVVTIAVAAFLIWPAIMTLTDPYDCSTMNRAVVILWVAVAVLFLASVAGVRAVARKIMPGDAGRLAVVAIHGMVLLASYVVLASGLMVAFEC